MAQKKLYEAVATTVLISGGLFTTPLPSFAQDGAHMLEEVTVTARRRAESMMSTPVSVTAFSGEDLQQRQIYRVNEISQSTPNLEFRNHANSSSGNHNAVVYIRGIGQSDFAVSTEPGVGIYVDDAYIAQASGAVMNLVDIESVQVLRGPQGTLLGRNTIGGAILVNTQKPHDELTGSAHAIAGSDDLWEVGGKLNLPLTDNLYSRLSVVARERDGWVDYPLASGNAGGGSEDTWGARLALRWLATDELTVDFSADYTNSKSGGPPMVLTSPIHNGFAPNGDPNIAAGYNLITAPYYGWPLFTSEKYSVGRDTYKNYGTEFIEADQDIWGATMTVEWALGDTMTLKSISNYRDLESIDGRDEDASDLAPISYVGDELDSEQFSQELQLSGEALNSRLNWTTGLYYFEDDSTNINPVQFSLFGLVSGAIVEKKSSAWFGQATYDFNEQWSLTLGGRYTDEQKDFIVDDSIQYITYVWGEMIGEGPGFIDVPPNAVTLASKGVTEADISHDDYHLNLSYHATEDLLTYFSYSQGFKGGGFVQRVIPGQEITSYEPEFADVYELGFKWEASTLRLTGAVFYTDYTDMQITIDRGFAPVTENAGDAEILGAELEILWLPTDNLKITGGVGLLDAEYTRLDPFATVTKDHELASAPEQQYNLSVAYDMPRTIFDGNLNFRLDYSYTSDYYLEAQNDPYQKQDAFGLLNGAITWLSSSEQWEVSLRGRNLTDEYYFTSPQGGTADTSNGFVTPTVGQPAEYSVRLGYRF